MSKVKALANKRVGHIDEFRITGNLPYKPDHTTQKQKLLKEGYRLMLKDGQWVAVKGSERIICQ